jgi:hypothetical protein
MSAPVALANPTMMRTGRDGMVMLVAGEQLPSPLFVSFAT